jgi:hypothetical protein
MPQPPASAPPAPTPAPAGQTPLAAKLGIKAVDVVPPGMKPSARPPEPAPIPASELTKKVTSPAAPAAAPSKFTVAVLAGSARGQRIKLAGQCQIGKNRGTLLLTDDAYASSLHATLTVRDGHLFVKDDGSASGTFLAVPGQAQIQQNVFFAAGIRLFRFMGLLNPAAAKPPASGAAITYGAPLPPGHVVYGVEEILLGNRGGRAVVTGGALLTIGTSKCDLSFPADEGMAARHCELSPTPQGALLRLQAADRQHHPADRGVDEPSQLFFGP